MPESHRLHGFEWAMSKHGLDSDARHEVFEPRLVVRGTTARPA